MASVISYSTESALEKFLVKNGRQIFRNCGELVGKGRVLRKLWCITYAVLITNFVLNVRTVP